MNRFLLQARFLLQTQNIAISQCRRLQTYTLDDVKTHASETDCWIVIDKNVTNYLFFIFILRYTHHILLTGKSLTTI